MASLEELRNARIKKIEKLKEAGVNPFPLSSKRTHTIREARDGFNTLSRNRKLITAAGRIKSVRGQGALIFLKLADGTADIQVMLKKDEMKESDHKLFRETVDIGDFVEIRGTLMLSKTKEKTVLAKKWTMLAKALRPLPGQWHGFSDVEERYRKRYLDILMNEQVRERFRTRSRIVAEIRKIFDEKDFLEVETSMLQPLAGGATAEPFVTHHNTLDIDLFLRIAPEIDLKKLLIAGYGKVFEVSRNFRNEGIDATHNPEFTTVEWYEAYSDAQAQQKFTEKLIRAIAKKIHGSAKFSFTGRTIDASKKFKTVSYYDILKKHSGLSDPANASMQEIKRRAKEVGAEPSAEDSREKLLDKIYEKTARPKLMQPTIITDYPVDYLPLAKGIPTQPGMVSAFQVVIGGIELVKAFSELNDPIEQRNRFQSQEKMRKEGDTEAQPSDEAFVEALEYGMPPAGGVGLSIDRLTMLLTDAHHIREVIIFPTLRPKN